MVGQMFGGILPPLFLQCTDRNKVKKCNLPCAVKVGNSNMVHC